MAFGFQIINGDWVMKQGSLTQVVGKAKVSRDFGKMLNTAQEYPKNVTTYTRYNPTYGSTLNQTEGYYGLNNQGIMDLIKSQLHESITSYIALQESRNNLDYTEIIANVDTMVYMDLTDAQSIRFDIVGLLATSESIPLGTFSQQLS